METKEPQKAPAPAWSREDILARARRLLLSDGSAARREIVLTTIELERLLREAP